MYRSHCKECGARLIVPTWTYCSKCQPIVTKRNQQKARVKRASKKKQKKFTQNQVLLNTITDVMSSPDLDRTEKYGEVYKILTQLFK